MYENKTQDVDEDFSNNREMSDFSNYSTKSNYDNSNKLVNGKAPVSWKFGHCSACTSLKMWWIIAHEH